MQYESNTSLQALCYEVPNIMYAEGFVKAVYRDSLGHLTFGVGTLIKKNMPEYGKPIGTPVSEKRCAQAFFQECISEVLGEGEIIFGEHVWNGFPLEAKRVFMNMIYNLGRTRFKGFKKMIAAAKRHDWKTAAAEAKDSLWYRQVKTRGERIVKRLESLA